MVEIVTAIISGISLVLVSAVTLIANGKKRETEEKASRKEQESKLSMELMSANCALAVVTAKAVTGGHTNGDVAEALQKALAAQEKYEEFLRGEVAKELGI